MPIQGISPVWGQELDQLTPLVHGEGRGDATCCSWPASFHRPSRSEPTMVPGPFLCQRKPATTQSAVRRCLTSWPSRVCRAGTAGRAAGHDSVQPRALEDVKPVACHRRPCRRREQDRSGVIGQTAPRRHAGRQGGASRRSAEPSAVQSKATNGEGVSAASIATRAGGRMDPQQQDSESPASHRGRSRSRHRHEARRASRPPSAARSAPGSIGPAASGPRLQHSSGPSRKTRARKPSHSARSASRRQRAARGGLGQHRLNGRRYRKGHRLR